MVRPTFTLWPPRLVFLKLWNTHCGVPLQKWWVKIVLFVVAFANDSFAGRAGTCTGSAHQDIFCLFLSFFSNSSKQQIYVSMDYESRFLGKEIVGLVANRVGKSATAIGLAIITLGVDPGVFRCVTPFLLCIISCLWLFASYRLVICLNKNKVE